MHWVAVLPKLKIIPFQGGGFITEPSQLRDYAKRLYDDVKEFVQEEIIPIEHCYTEHEHDSENRWNVIPEIEMLKAKVSSQNRLKMLYN